MPSQADVIKEYLVSLGFQVDNDALNKFKDSLENLSKMLQEKASSMSKAYIIAATEIVSALLTVTTATALLLDKIAQADLGYQKYALRMYMARDAAKELKIVTDAMGESLEDIAWNPELSQRYKGYMAEARGMETPKNAEEQLKYIRDIRSEFTRLKIEITYGMQHVGMYLFKFLQEPIVGSKLGMKELNDYIQQHLPEIARTIAENLAIVINFGRDLWKILKDCGSGAKYLWDTLSDKGKANAVLLVFAGLIAATGPLGRLLAALTLLQDFYKFIHNEEGREKRLDPYWEKLFFAIAKVYYIAGEAFARLSMVATIGGLIASGEFKEAARLTKALPEFYAKTHKQSQDDYNATVRGYVEERMAPASENDEDLLKMK
jgi:hypothetical protein